MAALLIIFDPIQLKKLSEAHQQELSLQSTLKHTSATLKELRAYKRSLAQEFTDTSLRMFSTSGETLEEEKPGANPPVAQLTVRGAHEDLARAPKQQGGIKPPAKQKQIKKEKN